MAVFGLEEVSVFMSVVEVSSSIGGGGVDCSERRAVSISSKIRWFSQDFCILRKYPTRNESLILKG